ncbi:MAG TPA: glycoside hydrolase family 44 protein [Planctomycetota bacterium]|nr:glycoside hydrolase family 44 protein [Planctomycetota bacterium]
MINRLTCALALVLYVSALQAETITIDANANRKPIDPRIYGIAYGDATTLSDLNVPLNRLGGNNTSRYNWQQNADNRGFDWYFESIGDSSATAGERGDSFIRMSKNAGAQPMMTIPMVGYVAKLGANRSKLASYSIAKYGAQTGNDWQWMPDAGNGIRASNGTEITNNDPLDANIPADSTFQQAWVQHIVNTHGTAANGGLRYYILDNEYSIWHSTHRDVHPTGATMDEVKNKMIDYATKIKAIDPGAIIVGPEEWGWSGYFYSGYDQQWGSKNGWSNLPDRANHGGMDYLPYLLDQLNKSSAAAGKRLLDVFTVHYYPQGGEFSDDTSSAMQLRRNRSTRSLWDPNYVDETWIGTQVRLIPRLKGWVNQYYPNTPIGITEYNWGAENHINGATTQADILGIFGREGLDLAARWTTPSPATPTYKAMKMYRNYDGNKSTFGETSVAASVTNPDNLSAFAALRSSDGAMTVMVINKTTSSNAVTLNLANFLAGSPAQRWQLTSSNAIARQADVGVSSGSLSATVPAQSITLFVIPAGSVVVTPAAPSNLSATATSASQINLSWTDNASNETGFKIERKTGVGGTYAQIAAVGSNVSSYSDSGLSASTQYFYRVRASGSSGDSAYSNEASATTHAAPVSQGPFGGTVRAIPGTIQAEDYDVGGEGVAYHDVDAVNSGAQYRTSEGVDVETCADSGGGFNVGYIQAGEWLEYTVNVTAGTYDFNIRVAASAAGGSFHIEFNGVDKTGVLAVPGTGGWQNWQSVTKNGVALTGGQQVMRLFVDSGGFNVNLLTVATPPAPPPPPPSFSVTIDSVSTGNVYSLGKAQIGALQYTDRSYTISALSGTLNGGVLVRQANNDKNVTAATHVTLTISDAATVYVCYDKRVKTLPAWMSGWTLTSLSLSTTDKSSSPMKVYSKAFAAGKVVLGGNAQPPASGAQTNYIPILVGTNMSRMAARAANPLAPGQWKHDGDSDGDGLLDAFELAVGLNPNQVDTGTTETVDEEKIASNGMSYFNYQILWRANSGAGGGNGAGDGSAFSVARLQSTLNFKQSGRDTLTLTAVLPLTQLPAAESEISFNIGGVPAIFTLAANGRGKNNAGTLKLSVVKKLGVIATLSLKGDFAASLADEGLTAQSDIRNAPATVPVQVMLGGVQYSAGADGTWSAKRNVSGRFNYIHR